MSCRTSNDGTVWMLAETFVKLFKFDGTVESIVEKHVSLKNVNYTICTGTDDKRFDKCAFLNSSGILELLCRSRVNYAREFTYWLLNVLLPSICTDPTKLFDEWRSSEANGKEVKLQTGHANVRGCVYIVTTDPLKRNDSLYKIGHTFELRECLDRLNEASPYEFYAEHLQLTENCVELERAILERFAIFRVSRGFFKLGMSQLRTVIDFCKTFCAKINN
jgi:prophage antirepressor-like protein